MPTGMLTVSMNEGTPAVPMAPPVPGLEADTAATAVDPKAKSNPFEELWAIYPRKHHRAKAQAAYKALAPDPSLHAMLVVKAVAWAEHYEKTATDKKWWKHMHNWLSEERYLEDLPEPYENPKEAAIARARKKNGPGSSSKPQLAAARALGLSPKTPTGRHPVKVVGSEMPDDINSPEQRFKFLYRIEGGDHEGKEFSHTFKCLSADENQQIEGMSIFSELRHATGIIEPQDTSDLHDKCLRAVVGGMGRIRYEAL
jgi:hypothetical protein